MLHHACHLLGSRQIALGNQVAHVHVYMAKQLVAHHLHGLGKVEREVIGVTRNGHQAVALLHFVDAKPISFVAKHQRDLLPRLGGGKQAGGELARGLQRRGEFAAAAG